MSTKKLLLITICTLLLLIPLSESMGNVIALASVSEQRIVQTYGESELTAKPDLAKINIAIETKSRLAHDAVQENARITNMVINALLDFGLSESDIKTSSYRLNSYRESQKEQLDIKEDLIYYQATNDIIVSTTQLDIVGEIIDLAVISGANNINFISFELRDPQDLMLQALHLATQQAYRKAEAITRSLNENIATLLTVKEEKTAYTPFRFQDNTLQREVAFSSVATPIEPGDVTIRATVLAEFSLLAK